MNSPEVFIINSISNYKLNVVMISLILRFISDCVVSSQHSVDVVEGTGETGETGETVGTVAVMSEFSAVFLLKWLTVGWGEGWVALNVGERGSEGEVECKADVCFLCCFRLPNSFPQNPTVNCLDDVGSSMLQFSSWQGSWIVECLRGFEIGKTG